MDAAPAKKGERRLIGSVVLPAIAVVILWCVYLLDEAFGLQLVRYALYPRDAGGLLGIATAPFLHSHTDNMSHIWNNSVALLMLGWGLMYFYPRVAGRVVLLSVLIGGAGVWLTGRASYHLGASGVVYGIAAFLFLSGLLRRQRTLMALSLLVVFLYGSLIWGILPLVPNLSWESHLWGAFAGVISALIYRSVPPAVHDPEPVHFEDEEEDPTDGPGPVPEPPPVTYHLRADGRSSSVPVSYPPDRSDTTE
ncbi:MAG: rhomboid family intramembrane serine protease [Flavobacteriales bacterium]|nr:rhomboid family intramembrane serine protease [Flavobacteriales bacterium]